MRCGPVLRGIGPYARRFFLGDPPSGSRPHPGASSSPFPPPGASSRRTRPRGLAGPAPRLRLGSSRASPVVLASLFLRLPRPGVPAPASARGTPRCPFADASAPWGSRGVWKGAGIGPGAAPPPRTPVSRLRRAARASVGVVLVWVRSGSGLRPPSFPFPPSRPAPRRPVVPLTTGSAGSCSRDAAAARGWEKGISRLSPCKQASNPLFLFLSRFSRPQIRRGDPLNLSILVSGGKETNQDSLSNGE